MSRSAHWPRPRALSSAWLAWLALGPQDDCIGLFKYHWNSLDSQPNSGSHHLPWFMIELLNVGRTGARQREFSLVGRNHINYDVEQHDFWASFETWCLPCWQPPLGETLAQFFWSNLRVTNPCESQNLFSFRSRHTCKISRPLENATSKPLCSACDPAYIIVDLQKQCHSYCVDLVLPVVHY
jgi:hypothetical protein